MCVCVCVCLCGEIVMFWGICRRFSGLDRPTREPLDVVGERDAGSGLGFVVPDYNT